MNLGKRVITDKKLNGFVNHHNKFSNSKLCEYKIFVSLNVAEGTLLFSCKLA